MVTVCFPARRMLGWIRLRIGNSWHESIQHKNYAPLIFLAHPLLPLAIAEEIK